MNRSQLSLEQILERHLQTLALTLRPGTVGQYRSTVRRFLAYLRGAFPRVRRASQLRRDPHLLGWFRSLCEQQPPLDIKSRAAHLILLRRLLDDLAANHPSLQPALIRREDIPRQPRCLPRPLSTHDDSLLQQELRRIDDLKANALLLIRATGVRIGECIRLSLECLREIGPGQWALLVPLGKLHTERLVPADPEVRRIVARILALRALAPPFQLAKAQGLLLPRWGGAHALYMPLCRALTKAAQQAGCSTHVTPHRLRHSFATEMLRLGVSLPALMQLLGHTALGMTLRYVQVTQQDLQREFHQARQQAARTHRLPTLPLPSVITHADLRGIHQALTATRHLLEMYRRQTSDPKTKRKLHRLDRRLLAVASQLDRIATVEK
jgi:site-specific recombinase XerD